MNLIKRFQEKFSFRVIHFLFLGSFALWIFMFRGFLSGHLALGEDAIPYLGHVNYFLENITRGIYPAWDPSYAQYGTSNIFFLRRIGEFNPFWYLIVVLNKLGLTYIHAYLVYLAVYFFTGAIGFYNLARLLWADTRMAFLAFLLFLFSSLGTRLFDAYLALVFVPEIWFFYFLVAFSRKPQRHSFLGMTFTLMIILTTYLPFYFFTVLFSFIFFFTIFYLKNLKSIWVRYINFISRNKILFGFCVFILICSFIPGLMLHQEASRGDFMMSRRHATLAEERPGSNVMVVVKDWVNVWSMLEELTFSSYFMDNLPELQFQVFYLPLFAYLILLLGAVTAINKRSSFLAFWGFFLFVMCISGASVYGFLDKYVFFFKYFRNLHFFLWISILPIAILFLVGQLKAFLEYIPARKHQRRWILALLLVVHIGAVVFLANQDQPIVSSFLVVLLSFIFFACSLYGYLNAKGPIFLILFFMAVIIEPVEAYRYLAKNSPTYEQRLYSPLSYFKFSFRRCEKSVVPKTGSIPASAPDKNPQMKKAPPEPYYMAQSISYALRHMDYDVLSNYACDRFLLYDNVKVVDRNNFDIGEIEKSLSENRNLAFVFGDKDANVEGGGGRNSSPYVQAIRENSDRFNVVAFTVNSIKLKTNFSKKEFLVYNDSFYPGWQAFINGKRTKLWQANVAFKGLWIPAGENTVYLRFGSIWRYCGSLFLVFLFPVVFAYLLWLSGKYYFLEYGNPK